MKKLIIFGAGGHCNSCIDIILREKKYKIDFIVDDNINDYKKFNIKIKNLTFFKKNFNKTHNLFVGVGLIKNAIKRLNLIKKLEKYNLDFGKILSPNSVISKYSSISAGTIVMHNCVVNSNVTIKQHTIINTSSVIEHDVIVGKNTHISTGVIINGGSKVGDNTFIGSGTIVHQNIKIGNNCLIGAGKVVKRNIAANSIIK